MATCLVTGGAGFVGSHIVQGLLRDDHEVRVIDDFSTGSASNIEHVIQGLRRDGLEPKIRVCEGTILDRAFLDEAIAGVQYVFHEAALPSVAFSLENPEACNRANVEGTLRVLLAARDAGVERLVYASSSSAYGDSPMLPKREDLAAVPLSPYATAKLAGEHYCRSFARVYGLETVALRYFNVFGERQNPNSQYSAVIPRFITALLDDEPLQIFGDGKQSRDFTHVDNVVQANLLAMRASDAAGEVMNVASGDRTSLLDLVGHLEALLACEARIEFREGRTGDVRHSHADISKARQKLGYSPKISVREGLALTIPYYEQR